MAAGDKLDWDDLRYFLSAAQCRTLAGAARALGVEHTTVGRRLSSLERSLGAPVVVRSADGLHLTPLGQSLVPLVEQAERVVRAVQDHANKQPMRVRLAMPTGFTRLFTANLERLQSERRVSLELLSGSRPVDLHKGEADLAIRSGPVADEALVARKLGSSGWSLYASRAYLARRPAPVDLDDFTGHELICYDPSLASVPAAQWIEHRARKATIVLRSREMTDMLAAALSGAGIALLPCLLGDEETGLVRLTPDVLATRELWLAYRREVRSVAPVRAVIRFVLDVMRENADRVCGLRANAELSTVTVDKPVQNRCG